MAEITDPKQAGERLLTYAREGRLVQGTWRDEQDGREVACHLGAAAGIDDADECPASLMPKWMAYALPSLFDGQSKAHAIAFSIRWGEAMLRDEWRRIDWDPVRREWLSFIVKQAKDAASAAARASAYAARAAYAAAYAAARASGLSASDDAAAAARYEAARDAQGDALMDAIERAMEVARG